MGKGKRAKRCDVIEGRVPRRKRLQPREVRGQDTEAAAARDEGRRVSNSLVREEEEGLILALPNGLVTLAKPRQPDGPTDGSAKGVIKVPVWMGFSGGGPFDIIQAGQVPPVLVILKEIAMEFVAALLGNNVNYRA